MNTPYIGGTFDLIDHFGRSVTNQTYLGRHALIFFGFTHCRMVCPRMLGRISEALAGIGQLADLVQPLYITVDPERDTPTVMRDFLQASFPLFTGLTGTLEQIERIKNVYKVFAQKKADELDPDGYAVPHTAFVYLIGPDGQYQTHFSDATEVAKMAERLRSILSNI